MTNYRSKIEEIIARYEKVGDCLGESILEGAPDVIDWDSALGIANWLRDYADNEWNPDPRHAEISAEILALAEEEGGPITHERNFGPDLLDGVEVRHHNGQCPYGRWRPVNDALHVPRWVGDVIADQVVDGDEDKDMIVTEGGDSWMWRRGK